MVARLKDLLWRWHIAKDTEPAMQVEIDIDDPRWGALGLEALVEVVDHLGVLDIVEVRTDQQARRLELALCPFHPILGQGDVLGLLILLVMFFADLI